MQIASINNSPGGRVGAKLVINVTHYGYGGTDHLDGRVPTVSFFVRYRRCSGSYQLRPRVALRLARPKFVSVGSLELPLRQCVVLGWRAGFP